MFVYISGPKLIAAVWERGILGRKVYLFYLTCIFSISITFSTKNFMKYVPIIEILYIAQK